MSTTTNKTTRVMRFELHPDEEDRITPRLSRQDTPPSSFKRMTRNDRFNCQHPQSIFNMARSRAVFPLSALLLSAFFVTNAVSFFVSTPLRVIPSRTPRMSRMPVSAATAARCRPAAMAMSIADVCRGDTPTPGWVRMAQRNLKKISVGDQLPDVKVRRLDDEGKIRTFSLLELFGDKKGVLVGVPGAFTPTSSQVHLPDYVDNASRLQAKGAEVVAFVAVNDVYVMRAWEEVQGAKGKVLMLSDGNGDLAAALGMMVDLTNQGMGLRCKRFVCVVEGGVVSHTRIGDEAVPMSALSVEKALGERSSDIDLVEKGPVKGGLLERLIGREVETRAAEAAV